MIYGLIYIDRICGIVDICYKTTRRYMGYLVYVIKQQHIWATWYFLYKHDMTYGILSICYKNMGVDI